MNHRRAIPRVLAVVLAWLSAVASAAENQSAVAIALIDLEYHDTSGEPTDQTEAHAARLKRFMDALRDDLSSDGRFMIVEPRCDPPPCSISGTETGALLDAARAAGANLMLYGGIRKASTLIQFANVIVSDVEHDRVVAQRALNFRGDDDRSWMRAEQFRARQLIEELAHWRPD